MKKAILLLCAVLLMSTLLAGCGKKSESAKEPEGMYVSYNGANITLGVKFADIKDSLGEQTAPEEVILPCDGGDAYKDTMHFYAGLAVTENKDGIVSQIEISTLYEGEGDAALNGKVKIGDKQEDAVAALGEPDTWPIPEDDYALTYAKDNAHTIVFLDPDTNKETVSGVYMTLVQP